MRLGVDEDVEVIVIVLLLIGALPFVMYWLERQLDEAPRRKRSRGRNAH